MPKKPKCKLCGERHWLSEGHTNVTTNVTPDTNVTLVKPPTSVTGRGFGSGAGRPREHKTNAERQKAYRGRKDV